MNEKIGACIAYVLLRFCKQALWLLTNNVLNFTLLIDESTGMVKQDNNLYPKSDSEDLSKDGGTNIYHN